MEHKKARPKTVLNILSARIPLAKLSRTSDCKADGEEDPWLIPSHCSRWEWGIRTHNSTQHYIHTRVCAHVYTRMSIRGGSSEIWECLLWKTMHKFPRGQMWKARQELAWALPRSPNFGKGGHKGRDPWSRLPWEKAQKGPSENEWRSLEHATWTVLYWLGRAINNHPLMKNAPLRTWRWVDKGTHIASNHIDTNHHPAGHREGTVRRASSHGAWEPYGHEQKAGHEDSRPRCMAKFEKASCKRVYKIRSPVGGKKKQQLSQLISLYISESALINIKIIS